MSTVAIIPARGGSQRIPRKNLKLFDGQPIIAWSIRTALASGLFDEVVVSTDDDEIAEVARAHGAQVPFRRPANLADHHTGTTAVIQHALQALGSAHDLACCIYATAPLLQAWDLLQGLMALQADGDKCFAFSVCSFAFPVQRALRLDGQGGVAPLYPEFVPMRSQDLAPAWHDAGQFYWGRRDAWLQGLPMFAGHSVPVVLPRHRVQDIDTPEDWRRAEYLFAALKAAGELTL
ncbi:N-Acetylneuraminate cytidylyltransferase [Pseudomonas sp. M47T1]|uniref:pseudaminic acid cytidylyltransferase n=1 Tax=unclassified Pseudomonas TaxID=196821 RepID=UPI000260864A|nr:pseudaminic acid cytidylyltransferase [Pseudomonas sp. M47T1]EIK93540.1 N-Acetylneuraminate cytidylyltransferase [Pseudomonas sp. M47T1]